MRVCPWVPDQNVEFSRHVAISPPRILIVLPIELREITQFSGTLAVATIVNVLGHIFAKIASNCENHNEV